MLALTSALRKGLVDLGLNVLTPESDERRLGIVAVAIDDEAIWRRGLETRNILGWVGDRRLRLSPHVYNSGDDIIGALEAIEDLLRVGEGKRSA